MIDINTWEDQARITVGCDLDDAFLPQFEAKLVNLSGDDRHRIIVDLTTCPYISSSSVTALIQAYRKSPGFFEVLIAERGTVHKFFEVCGFIDGDFLVRFAKDADRREAI